MKIFPLILARGGSKRLPDKNRKELANVPLIAWTIETAKFIDDFEEVIVSTDDEAIAEISRKHGAKVPWLRPIELSGDNSSSAESAIHALNWAEKEIGKFDAILLLQPTSPFRTAQTINKGIRIFSQNPSRSVIGVKKKSFKEVETLIMNDDNYMSPGIGLRKKVLKSSRDIFLASGNFYMMSCDNLRKHQSFYTDNSVPLFSSYLFEEIDIDTQEDFYFANQIANQVREYLPW